jgi:CRISPR-associated endonuclease/helicase Cas3
MSTNPQSGTAILDRRNIPLEEAFRVMTENRLAEPNALQKALFPRLTTQDTGLLLPTGPCAGRLEAIAIPSLVAMRIDETAHRLFIIGPDGCPLDDYMYRLAPYVRSLVMADGVPRSIWFEEPDRAPIARKYFPDGSLINGSADSPFSEEVDTVVMPFSHFRTVFFNAGGVHGVPEGIGFDRAVWQGMGPRGLFYFDEAYGATRDRYQEFLRMVEFLFAQDLDIVVGGSSLPESAHDELSFLEWVSLPDAERQPARSLHYIPTTPGEMLARIEQAARETDASNDRIAIVLNDPDDSRLVELHALLSGKVRGDVHLYRTADSRAERGRVYARLREAEKHGGDYVVVTDGPAIEVSDLDTTTMICEPCSALSLVRRSGRCNRRGQISGATLRVIGDAESAVPSAGLAVSENRRDAVLNTYLQAREPIPFDPALWKNLVG